MLLTDFLVKHFLRNELKEIEEMSYPKQVMPEGHVFSSLPPPPPSLSKSSIHKVVEMNNWQKCEEMLKENKELVKEKVCFYICENLKYLNDLFKGMEWNFTASCSLY